MLKKSKELFESWNRNSLIYCHWKSNEHLMEGLDGDTDLDVLLSPADKVKGISLLKEIGFISFRSQYGSRYPNVEDWIGFDVETGKLLHLHLHFALMTGHKGLKEYELPWIEECLKTRIQDKETGVFIMNPNLELVSLYTRLVLKAKRQWVRLAKKGKYTMDRHFFVEIEYIKKRVDWNEVTCIAERYYGDQSRLFVEIAQSETLSSNQFLTLHLMVSKKMRSCCRYNWLSCTVRIIYYCSVIWLRKTINKRCGKLIVTRKVADPLRGFSVAFIGQDGSGKSTLTEDIKKWLTWKIESQRFYLGSGDHYHGFMKFIIHKISERHKDSVNQRKVNLSNSRMNRTSSLPQGVGIKRQIMGILSAINYKSAARHAYKEVLRSASYMSKGGIALYDRFPQNQFSGIYDGPKINTEGLSCLYRRLMDLYAKKEKKYILRIQEFQPTIVFKLLLPPEESIIRKPHENFESIAIKAEITRQLVFDDSKVYEVDATQDYEQELLFVKRAIWSQMSQIPIDQL